MNDPYDRDATARAFEAGVTKDVERLGHVADKFSTEDPYAALAAEMLNKKSDPMTERHVGKSAMLAHGYGEPNMSIMPPHVERQRKLREAWRPTIIATLVSAGFILAGLYAFSQMYVSSERSSDRATWCHEHGYPETYVGWGGILCVDDQRRVVVPEQKK